MKLSVGGDEVAVEFLGQMHVGGVVNAEPVFTSQSDRLHIILGFETMKFQRIAQNLDNSFLSVLF